MSFALKFSLQHARMEHELYLEKGDGYLHVFAGVVRELASDVIDMIHSHENIDGRDFADSEWGTKAVKLLGGSENLQEAVRGVDRKLINVFDDFETNILHAASLRKSKTKMMRLLSGYLASQPFPDVVVDALILSSRILSEGDEDIEKNFNELSRVCDKLEMMF